MDIQTNSDTTAPATTATDLRVTGMHCSSCEHHIEAALLALPGVSHVEIDRRAGRVRVAHAATTNTSRLLGAVEQQGYAVSLARSPVTGRDTAG